MPKEDVNGGKEDIPAGSEILGSGRRNPPPALLVLIAAFAIAGYFGYQEFQERLVTLHEEDARIRAEMVTISSRVAGWVTAVSAKEGETVEVGTALIVIDDRGVKAVVRELNAELEGINAEKERLKAQQILVRKQTESKLIAERSELSAAQVVVSSLVPQLKLSKRELERTAGLFRRKVASRRQVDQSQEKLQKIEREHEIALAKVSGARARVRQAEVERARLDVLDGDLIVLGKREAQIKARKRRHKLDIGDRVIESPLKGIVDRRFVDIGEYVLPGQRLVLIHDPERIWIEANIKETEVRRLKTGQSVEVTVDAYPEENFKGYVERIGSSATSTFALLPSPNPSGNFTKITQRLPIRISINQKDGRFRPGMMVEIKIATGR